ncbi:MAG TPA: biopolymer transporter ExbD [Planctomycetaceae bacterium]|nr:biopolymer transporter ExbD [Planctomycetaceae bacterium]
MRFPKRPMSTDEADLTPMIDMTFQLIAFFMVLINFTKAEASDEVKLPDSDLARPPETVPDFRILVSVLADGRIMHGGAIIDRATLLKPYLDRELLSARAQRVEVGKIKVIIRGHMNSKMGKVQEVMEVCREVGLEDFTFRVKERPRLPGMNRFTPLDVGGRSPRPGPSASPRSLAAVG